MSEKLTRDQQQKLDMETLLARAEFIRFLFEMIQRGGVLEATAHGSDERTFVAIGRRQLALELLGMVEIGQPVAHPDKLPILTLLQVLREEAQQSTENPNGKTARYDRTADVFTDADDDEDDPG